MATKLNKMDKSVLKDYLELMTEYCENTGCMEIYQFPETGLTLLIAEEFEGSRMARVWVSFMSPDEPKFKRKVGDLMVLQKWQDGSDGIVVPVLSEDFYIFAKDFSDLFPEMDNANR